MLKLKITSEVEKIAQMQSSLRDLTEVYGAWSDDVRDLARKNARSYSRGGGFWESIARSVRSGYNADGGQVWSDHYAARHKDQGGPITAKNKPWLTIPIHAISRGRNYASLRADGYKMFRPGPADNKRRVLGYVDQTGRFVALFALCRQTRAQRAFAWWPGVEDVRAIGMAAVMEHIS